MAVMYTATKAQVISCHFYSPVLYCTHGLLPEPSTQEGRTHMYHDRKKETPWTFYNWIIRFKGVDLPIGDLAEDISKDPKFPKEDYFSEILTHLSDTCNYDTDTIETFTLAWGYYLASKDPSRPEPNFTNL